VKAHVVVVPQVGLSSYSTEVVSRFDCSCQECRSGDWDLQGLAVDHGREGGRDGLAEKKEDEEKSGVTCVETAV